MLSINNVPQKLKTTSPFANNVAEIKPDHKPELTLATFNPEISRSKGRCAIELLQRYWQISNMPASMLSVTELTKWREAVTAFINNDMAEV